MKAALAELRDAQQVVEDTLLEDDQPHLDRRLTALRILARAITRVDEAAAAAVADSLDTPGLR